MHELPRPTHILTNHRLIQMVLSNFLESGRFMQTSHLTAQLYNILLNDKQSSLTQLHTWLYYHPHPSINPPMTSRSGETCGTHSESRFRPTNEQQRILSHPIQADHVVKIMAFAGEAPAQALQVCLHACFNQTLLQKPALQKQFKWSVSP